MANDAIVTEIGLCCVDLVETERWYRETLGLTARGGMHRTVPWADGSSEQTATEAICWWLAAGDTAPRLGLYQFSDPLSELLPYDHTPGDHGLVALGFHVPAFDAVIARMAASGSAPEHGIDGQPGSRHARVRDPDGVSVDLFEHDPLSATPRTDDTGVALRQIVVASSDRDATAKIVRRLLPVMQDDPGGRDFWTMPGCRVTVASAADAIQAAHRKAATVRGRSDHDRLRFEHEVHSSNSRYRLSMSC